jgi:hypothetical protein
VGGLLFFVGFRTVLVECGFWSAGFGVRVLECGRKVTGVGTVWAALPCTRIGRKLKNQRFLRIIASWRSGRVRSDILVALTLTAPSVVPSPWIFAGRNRGFSSCLPELAQERLPSLSPPQCPFCVLATRHRVRIRLAYWLCDAVLHPLIANWLRNAVSIFADWRTGSAIKSQYPVWRTVYAIKSQYPV